MSRKLIVTIMLSMALILGLAACAPFKPIVVPSKSTYVLNPGPIKAAHGRADSATTLLVLMPEASPGYHSSDMVYTLEPYQLQSYANHSWVAPPAKMLLPLLVQQLGASGHFHAVVGTPFSGAAQYRLTTQLLELRQDFSSGAASIERMAMAAQLIDNRTQRVIASQTFKAQALAPGNNPESGVAAANRATQSILHQIAQFVVRNT